MSQLRSVPGSPDSNNVQGLQNDTEVSDAGDSHFQFSTRQHPNVLNYSEEDQTRNKGTDLGHESTTTMDESDSDASQTVFTPEASSSEEEETESDTIRGHVLEKSWLGNSRHPREFYEAVEQGNIEAVTVLLAAGCSIDHKTDNGYTPLVIALLEGQLEMAEFLLENHASVHQRVDKLPSIIYAAMKPALPLQFMQLLLDYGAIMSTPFGPYYYNVLHWAISNGNVDAVDLLVSRGVDMEETCDKGRTALLVAAKFGETTVAKVLLAKGANISHRSHNGNTALVCAAYCGHADSARLLLEEGLDVDDRNGMGISSLWIASSFGHREVVELLLRNGANINSRSHKSQNFTPIMAAVITGHADVVQLLIEHGADLTIVNSNGNTVLMSALHQGRPHIVNILLNALGGPDYPQESLALDIALAPSDEAIRTLMMTVGLFQPNCDSHDSTREITYSETIEQILRQGGELIQAYVLFAMTSPVLHEDDISMVVALLNNGFNPNQVLASGQRPLHVAITKQDFVLAELLLDWGADPSMLSCNPEGPRYTPLDQALLAFDNEKDKEKDTLIIDLLIENRMCKLMKGEDVHSTAFSYVLSHHSLWPSDMGLTMTSTMLQWAEDIHDDRSDDGSTLLHAAVYHGRTDVVDLLLSRGVDINAVDAQGCTPFYLECKRSTRLLRFLVFRGADAHMKGPDGQSALHIAAGSGKLEIVDFLLHLDFDIEVVDDEDHTPLAWALILGQEDAVLHLRGRGAALPTKKLRRGRTMLHLASSLGMLRFARILLADQSPGVDVNSRDDMGRTPLALACRRAPAELVVALLEAGADLEASPDNKDDRPIHLALRAGNTAVAEELVLHSADVMVRGDQCQTPLHLAAQLSDLSIVQILLDHGTELSALDDSGRTALSLCSDPDVAYLLIHYGANVNHADIHGWTPTHFAVASENLEVLRVLVQNSADVDARTLYDGVSVLERIESVADEEVRRGMEDVVRDDIWTER